MTVNLAKWTIDEYHQMVEAGIITDRQVVLIKGEIVEMPSEGIPHAVYSGSMADYLRQLLGPRVIVREGHHSPNPVSHRCRNLRRSAIAFHRH